MALLAHQQRPRQCSFKRRNGSGSSSSVNSSSSNIAVNQSASRKCGNVQKSAHHRASHTATCDVSPGRLLVLCAELQLRRDRTAAAVCEGAARRNSWRCTTMIVSTPTATEQQWLVKTCALARSCTYGGSCNPSLNPPSCSACRFSFVAVVATNCLPTIHYTQHRMRSLIWMLCSSRAHQQLAQRQW